MILVFDVGNTETTIGLYDGETLEQRIARGLLAVAEATDVAVQMLRGLAKALEAEALEGRLEEAGGGLDELAARCDAFLAVAAHW